MNLLLVFQRIYTFLLELWKGMFCFHVLNCVSLGRKERVRVFLSGFGHKHNRSEVYLNNRSVQYSLGHDEKVL